jgi:hypothetical protein
MWKMTIVCCVVLTFSTRIIAADSSIPPEATVYVVPTDGYDTYIVAALAKKKVPVLVVNDKAKADFEISAVSQSSKVGITRTILFGQIGTDETASFTVTNLKSGVVAFAYSVDKKNSVRGKQSSAESFAKNLADKIRKSDR